MTEDHRTQLASAIQQAHLLVCGDGSFDPTTNLASYGMVFGTEQVAILRAYGPCPGHPDHLSALCAI